MSLHRGEQDAANEQESFGPWSDIDARDRSERNASPSLQDELWPLSEGWGVGGRHDGFWDASARTRGSHAKEEAS